MPRSNESAKQSSLHAVIKMVESIHQDRCTGKGFKPPKGAVFKRHGAEYSIKPFAKWRKKVSKSLTKQNIENHLILLSILQTCKYQGINFFEFLKSGEMSIFDYLKK